MAEIVAGPVIEAGKVCLPWLVKGWGYAKNLEEHAKTLASTVDKLMQLRMDVEVEVERAQRERNRPRNEVLGWMKDSGEAITNGSRYLGEYEKLREGRKSWSRMIKPSSYKLGKGMLAMNAAITGLIAHRKFFKDEYAVADLPERVQRIPGGNIFGIQETPTSYATQAHTSSSLQLNSTKEMSSVEQTLDMILQSIQDSQIVRIGICGKGGIGKTTITKRIFNDKLYGTTRFDVEIFVVVSSDLNMRRLRLSIAKELFLDISAEEDYRAAKLLYNVLFKRKFFIVFDDVWEEIDLEALGVPAPTKTNGCKIVLTTRKIGVCRHMATDKEIHVSDLPENEAWKLFIANTGGVISSSIESTAKLICDECHGLPLALIVVGKALRRDNDVRVWQHKLNVLRSSQFALDGMEDKVFSPLKLSYDSLKSDTLRDCFLYCALFPEDYEIEIDRLIKYWVTEGLVDVHEGFAHALDKAQHDILAELLDSHLLERRNKSSETIYMHDVIRDMAIKITSVSNERGMRFLVNAGKGLDEWIEGNDLSEVNKISFMNSDIKTFIDAPNCPKLSTLLLLYNDTLEHVPDSFFMHMINLRVLDLSGTNINSLPQSINGLVNLHALMLMSCHSLRSIKHIEGLRSLLLLDLSLTQIAKLPDAIGELNCLRSLDLSYTRKLHTISPGTISKLTNLEVLEMQRCAYFEVCAEEEEEGIIRDIGCLRYLRHLTLDILSDGNVLFLIFPKFKKLASFHIRLGRATHRILLPMNSEGGLSKRSWRCLELRQVPNFALAGYADKLVLDSIDWLDSISSLGVHNLESLKELRVLLCQSISKAIIDDEEQIILPHLEALFVFELPKLPCVWEVKGVAGTFKSIRSIELDRCPCATHVFSIHVISELGCLEELKITNCESMEHIVRGADNLSREIPKLEYIRLDGLRSLKALWEQQVRLPALRGISICSCESLKHLPLSKEIAPVLTCIEGEQEWWDGLTWMNDAEVFCFQPLFKRTSQGQ